MAEVSDFKVLDLFIISNSRNLIPYIVFLISQPLDIVQKCFYNPDGAMDHTVQMKYVPAF